MPKPGRFHTLGRYFLAGVVSLLPLGVTLFILIFLIQMLGPILGWPLHYLPALARLPKFILTLLGFILLLIVILAIGVVATGAPGSWLLKRVSDFFSRLPLIRGVYGTARQLTDAVLVDRKSLKKVVLIEYPRRDVYSLAFLMSECPIEINGKECHTVFLPATPTPTSGWVHLIPVDAITEVDFGVDEALKLFISGGVVIPDAFRKKVCDPAGLPPSREPLSPSQG